MTTAHVQLLNMIKISIDQLANDETLSRRRTMRELIDIRNYILGALENIRNETSGETK
jgi:hypothetical protein